LLHNLAEELITNFLTLDSLLDERNGVLPPVLLRGIVTHTPHDIFGDQTQWFIIIFFLSVGGALTLGQRSSHLDVLLSFQAEKQRLLQRVRRKRNLISCDFSVIKVGRGIFESQ